MLHTVHYGKRMFMQNAHLQRCLTVFISLTCFGHFCDHLQGLVKQEYMQYTNNYKVNV
jgi:hypothetical protein